MMLGDDLETGAEGNTKTGLYVSDWKVFGPQRERKRAVEFMQGCASRPEQVWVVEVTINEEGMTCDELRVLYSSISFSPKGPRVTAKLCWYIKR